MLPNPFKLAFGLGIEPFTAALIGAGVLGGGAGYFGAKARKKAVKPIDPNLTPIRQAESFPDYTARQSLVNRIQEDPASYAGLFERELSQPRRAAALSDFTGQGGARDLLSQGYSARGLGGSSLAARDIGQARSTLGLQLALQQAMDRAKGLETGFSERRFKSGQLGQLGQFAAQQANLQSNQSLQRAGLMIPQQQAYRQAGADIFPTTLAGIGTGLSTFGNLKTQNALMNFLKSRTANTGTIMPTATA